MEFDFEPLKHSDGEFVFGPLQTKWLEALESEKYSQGHNLLRSGEKYCCLGVLCEVAQIPFLPIDGMRNPGYQNGDTRRNDFAPDAIADEIGFYSHDGGFEEGRPIAADPSGTSWCDSLVGLNDVACLTFKQIAAYIRYDPWNVFKKSA